MSNKTGKHVPADERLARAWSFLIEAASIPEPELANGRAHGEWMRHQKSLLRRAQREWCAARRYGASAGDLARLDAEHARLWKRCVNKIRR